MAVEHIAREILKSYFFASDDETVTKLMKQVAAEFGEINFEIIKAVVRDWNSQSINFHINSSY